MSLSLCGGGRSTARLKLSIPDSGRTITLKAVMGVTRNKGEVFCVFNFEFYCFCRKEGASNLEVECLPPHAKNPNPERARASRRPTPNPASSPKKTASPKQY